MTTRDAIAVILLLIAGLPMIGGSWLQYRRDVDRIATEHDQRLLAVAQDARQSLRNLVHTKLESARGDGGLPGLAEALRAAPADSDARLRANRFVTAIGSRDPLNIDSVALLDRDGRNRFDSAASTRGGDEAAEVYFRTTLASGLPQIVGPYRRAGESHAGVYVAAPIRDALDRPVGVLRLRFEPAMVDQALDARLRPHPQLGAALLDANGRPFAFAGQRVEAAALAGAHSAAPHPLAAHGGVHAQAVQAALPRSGWQLVVFEPLGVRTAALDERRDAWLASAALFAALLAAAALSIGWLVSRPVVRLTRGVDAIAAGDLQRRLSARGLREFRRLAQAVNAMNGRIRDNVDELSAELQHRRQAEVSLRASEERLSTLIEQIPGAVYRCAVDDDWTLQYISRNIIDLCGHPADALLHNRLLAYGTLIHSDDAANVARTIHKAIDAHRPYELRYRLVHRDGSVRWIWERGQAHHDADGNTAWLDGVLFDVTEQEQAERAMRTLRSSTEGLTGEAYFDCLTRALSSGPGPRLALLARSMHDGGLQPLALALDGEPIAAGGALSLAAACRSAAAGRIVLGAGAGRVLSLAGDTAPLQVESLVALPLHSHDRAHVLLVAHDRPLPNVGAIADLLEVCAARALAEIERDDALRALQALTGELERRVAARTAELEHSHRQLTQAMNQVVQSEKLASLGSLVAGVAHELNTPLGNALTAATALQERMALFRQDVASGQLRRSGLDQFVDESGEAGALIERNLVRAAGLIRHFKQVAVDTTSERRRRFALRSMVDEVLTMLSPRMKRLPHSIQVDMPDDIMLDSFPGALEQVVSNLVGNSLDHAFTPERAGTIRIEAEVDDRMVTLRYVDDGCGIPEAMQKRVFDPFFTTRMGSGGSGLGLYIVYGLVTGTLGGRIGLDSRDGAGTCFTLELPLHAPLESRPLTDPMPG